MQRLRPKQQTRSREMMMMRWVVLFFEDMDLEYGGEVMRLLAGIGRFDHREVSHRGWGHIENSLSNQS